MSRLNKTILCALMLIISVTFMISATTLKWKPMDFENPGTRRLFKSSAGNYYFYRSQPEKSMIINVKDLSAIEIRAISKAPVSNPEFFLKYENKRVPYNLALLAVSEKYNVFVPVKVTLPPGLTQLELICYERDIYFRIFQPVPVQSKKAKIPALKVISRLKNFELAGPTSKHTYYAFNDSAAFTFQVRKDLPFTIYVRAELTNRQLPIFGLYEDGKYIRKYELSLKRTNTYKAEGITHLTIGKKVDFPARDETVNYMLRAETKHQFIARPVIRKVQ